MFIIIYLWFRVGTQYKKLPPPKKHYKKFSKKFYFFTPLMFF